MNKIQMSVSQSVEQKSIEKIEVVEQKPIEQIEIQEEKPVYTAIKSESVETAKPKMSIEEKTNILIQLRSHDLSDAARNALIKTLSE